MFFAWLADVRIIYLGRPSEFTFLCESLMAQKTLKTSAYSKPPPWDTYITYAKSDAKPTKLGKKSARFVATFDAPRGAPFFSSEVPQFGEIKTRPSQNWLGEK